MEQANCLQAQPGAGARYMHLYDELSPRTRRLLQQAPFNLCIACLVNRIREISFDGDVYAEREAVFRMTREVMKSEHRDDIRF